ncbi:MAG: arylamine N-acetyltransferase [Actinomycetota bacterium]|nr:arylamine N-acetyltransferase [Actinomycetota bacterium]
MTRHRGGFCYELNGAFGSLLSVLGYHVTLLAARVWEGDRLSLPFDHLALRVECPEPWLVDVGFGAHSLYPLEMNSTGNQSDPNGSFA